MANHNEDCFSVNSDFERIPNTPMEREEEELFRAIKIPKSWAASKSTIDPAVAALSKKVDMLVVKVDGLSQENSQLRTHLAKFKHHEEHENAKFELVDNSKNACWDTAGSKLNVKTFLVKRENEGCSIRSMHGFPTGPINSTSDTLIYNIYYFEVTVNQKQGNIYVGLADKMHPMGQNVGFCNFGIGCGTDGYLYESGFAKARFGGGGFGTGDVFGCGIKVTQKTESAEAAKCEACIQKQCVIFFTKNGQLWGTPIPLPSDAPSMLYPAVSLNSSGDQVTTNFGQQPFKFAIPPAKGLNVCGHCCHCKQFV